MERTTLLFYVTNVRGQWLVRAECQCYGPFSSYSEAFARAHEEAEAAGTYGFLSAVLAQPAAGGAFELCWRCDASIAPALLH